MRTGEVDFGVDVRKMRDVVDVVVGAVKVFNLWEDFGVVHKFVVDDIRRVGELLANHTT